MDVKEKSTREKQRERKKRGNRKYGQARLKHSRTGVHACIYAGSSFGILIISIIIAYVTYGNVAGIIGWFGIMSAVLAALGIRAGIRGLRERDKDYTTCKLGIVLNIAAMLVWGMIFIGGF